MVDLYHMCFGNVRFVCSWWQRGALVFDVLERSWEMSPLEGRLGKEELGFLQRPEVLQ